MHQLKAIEEEDAGKPMLALPPSEGATAATRAVVAMPQTQAQTTSGAAHHQLSTQTREIDNRSTKMMIDADTQPRDYNDLMDQFSLH